MTPQEKKDIIDRINVELRRAKNPTVSQTWNMGYVFGLQTARDIIEKWK